MEAPVTREELERFVSDHSSFVIRLAQRLTRRLPASIDVDDVIQCGMIGLLDAARRYREQRNVTFTVFARRRVMGAMLDGLRRVDHASRDQRAMIRREALIRTRLEQRLHRRPSSREIAAELGISLLEYDRVRSSARALETVGFGGAEELEALALGPDACHSDALSSLLGESALLEMERALSNMDRKAFEAFTLYYFERLSMRSIGERLGIGEARVSQILAKATTAIRARFCVAD
jgi:RNA polymerase sigma factor for flagellar operon FliA